VITEKELIGKLRELRQIRPNKDWVVLAKSQILGQEFNQHRVLINWLRVFFAKPVYAGLVVVFVLVGLFGTLAFAQNSLPGQPLYLIKRITEKAQAVFVSEKEKPQASLELANKRLEELTIVAETNQVKNLAPAINEFQASVSEAAKNLSRIEATTTDPVTVKRFVDQAKNIEKKAKEVESRGVVIGELNGLQEARTKLELQSVVMMLKDLISRLEIRLEKGALTEEQEEILVQIKELVEEEKYLEAQTLFYTNQHKF